MTDCFLQPNIRFLRAYPIVRYSALPTELHTIFKIRIVINSPIEAYVIASLLHLSRRRTFSKYLCYSKSLPSHNLPITTQVFPLRNTKNGGSSRTCTYEGLSAGKFTVSSNCCYAILPKTIRCWVTGMFTDIITTYNTISCIDQPTHSPRH